MNNNRSTQNIMVLFFFILILLVYFSPALFQGLTLFPEDAKNHYFFTKAFLGNSLKDFKTISWWDPYMSSGFPLVSDPSSTLYYPFGFLFVLFSPIVAMNLLVLIHFTLAGYFTYLFCREVGCGTFGAVLGGMTYGLSGFMVGYFSVLAFVQTCTWFPLALFFLEKVRVNRSWGWGLGTILAMVLLTLSCATQLLSYILFFFLFYAAFQFWRNWGYGDGKAEGKFILRFTAVVLFSFLLCAFYLIPAYEFVSSQGVRKVLDYSFFISWSYPPYKFLTLCFPYLFGSVWPSSLYGKLGTQADPGFLEILCYAGLVSLMLMLAGLYFIRKDRLILFWTATALLGIFLALGCFNPLYPLFFHIPVFNRFRVPARALFLFHFAAAVLTGLVFTKLIEHGSRKKIVQVVIGIVAVAGLGVVLAVSLGKFSEVSLFSPIIFIPVLMMGLSGMSLLLVVVYPKIIFKAFLALVLFVDLFMFGQFYGWRELSRSDFHWDKVSAAVKEKLGGIPALGQARFFNLNYPVEENFGSITSLETLNGYSGHNGIDRYYELRGNLIWGGPNQLSFYNTPLVMDLLNTRYLLCELKNREFLEKGIRFNDPRVPWILSNRRPQCTISLQPALAGTHLAIISNLFFSFNIPDGMPVARISIHTVDGRVFKTLLLAGRDTAEKGYYRKEYHRLIRHRMATIAQEWKKGAQGDGYAYFCELSLKGKRVIKNIGIELLVPQVSLGLHSLTVVDQSAGRSRVVPCSLFDRERWTYLGKSGDIDLFENRLAFPRAWITSEIRRMDAGQIPAALWSGRLPEGVRFDPRRTALVEELGTQQWPADPKGRVEILSAQPDRMELRCSSKAGGFLVLSEIFYPGWKATLDGKKADIYRTDYILRGLPVPAGEHVLKFDFEPFSFYLGVVISCCSFFFMLFLWFLHRHPKDKEGSSK